MASYVLSDSSDVLIPTRITKSMFGGNGLNVNQGLENPSSVLVENIDKMGVKSLRYPGGGVTEKWFDMSNPEATLGRYDGSSSQIVGLSDFLDTASHLEADVNFVLPTVDGFDISAGEAILNGSYGNRSVRSNYLDEVKNFVWYLMDKADQKGVHLTSIEIGNEFWGSGFMTSSEYGRLAGAMAVAIEEAYLARGVQIGDQPKIVVQTISSAGVFSPREDQTVFVKSIEDEDSGETYYEFYDSDAAGLVAAVIPGQGDARTQNAALVAQINSVPGAADAIDAVSDHLYGKKGLDGIDEGQDAGFKELNRFIEYLDRSGDLPPLELHVTEWNAKADDGNRVYENNKGSEGAALMVEVFYELASNGITSAQVWPLEGGSLNTALSFLDGDGQSVPGLSFFGEMFRLMSESLIGLEASLDFSVQDEIDVHGFSSNRRDVFFVSERSGRDSLVELQLAEILQGDRYLITETRLTDGDTDGTDSGVEPIVTVAGGYTTTANSVAIELEARSNTRIEVTYITDGDDRISGREGDDRFFGGAGNDTLTGYEGNDTVFGEGGFDTIFGGRGDDYLDGGHQADNLFGKSGNDTIIGDNGRDRLFGGTGNDLLYGGDGNDVLFGDEGSDYLYGGLSDDLIHAGKGDDLIFGGMGSDVLNGNLGSDVLNGGEGRDYLDAGAGFDTLVGGAGDDTLTGGSNWDVFVFEDGFGKDIVYDFDVENQFEKIDLSGVQSITDFDDLAIYHLREFDSREEIFSRPSGTLIEDGLGNSILLFRVEVADLSADDFIF